MEQFKAMITSYCSLDDNISLMSKQQKEKRKEHAQLSEDIVTYMKSNNLEVCNAGELGVLTLKSQKSTGSVKKDQIKDSVVDVLNAKSNWKSENKEVLADELAEYIMEHRETKESIKLKRKKANV